MSEVNKRKIFLIPSLLSPGTVNEVLPPYISEVLNSVEFYFVEEIRTARRFISEVGINRKIEELKFFKLDKETTPQQLQSYFNELPKEGNIGVISEAGCPCIADPGSLIVEYGHQHNWEITPLVGPSSILLALISSGFNGQSFVFHGYLPIDKENRIKMIREMEKESISKKRTQLFMETPYRNNKLVEDLLQVCNPETRLCIAVNLTSKDQFIKTLKVKDWRKNVPDINKQPAMFLIYGG